MSQKDILLIYICPLKSMNTSTFIKGDIHHKCVVNLPFQFYTAIILTYVHNILKIHNIPAKHGITWYRIALNITNICLLCMKGLNVTVVVFGPLQTFVHLVMHMLQLNTLYRMCYYELIHRRSYYIYTLNGKPTHSTSRLFFISKQLLLLSYHGYV